tara:strand:- start:10092 stop:10361 length:270 start_codon:yes stop_codon:yes gene_type:complete
MKKKNLLQDWEIVQQEYYEQYNRSEIEEKYNDWFSEYDNVSGSMFEYPYMEKSEMIKELIADELEYRKDDTNEELLHLTIYIEKLMFNN